MAAAGVSVRYADGRYWKGDRPLFVVAADHQYYRDRRERWAERLTQLAAAGVNTVTFYVPWRHHRVEGGFDFTGETRPNRDLCAYLQIVADSGLYAVAKPGPFVHSELNIGGLPDAVSPSFAEGIEPVRDHAGEPCLWGYDRAQLPSSEDPTFDALALEWLRAAGEVLAPFAAPAGPIVGLQLNDETLYCTANAPPWTYGYDAPDVALYRRLLAERYGSLERYDALHGTTHASWDEVEPPRPGDAPTDPRALLAYVDWAELQWRLRRDSYARYADAVGIDLPRLTNFAPITPPIEENVPGDEAPPEPEVPPELAPNYADWWLAQNRVDADADVYHYGIISWLGVVAYDIADPRSVDTSGEGDLVLQRYVNTAGRRRGINLEENWGFAKLYHPFSKHPLIPVYQTLASVAGGCTGFVAFCGVQHDDWDDDLDRITRQGCPTFPSHAPVAADGTLTPLHDALTLLGRWFQREGEALLRCEPAVSACWLIYPPYAAVSGWLAAETVGEHAVPRCGVDLEAFALTLQRVGYGTTARELDATELDPQAWPVVALRLGFFMEPACQERLVRFVEAGGHLVWCGEPPSVDLELAPCTILADALARWDAEPPAGRVVRVPDDGFRTGAAVDAVAGLGVSPALTASPGLRAFVHTGPDDEAFVFVFQLGAVDAGTVELPGRGRLELTLGRKTCAVVHVRGDALVSALIKGVNEVEDVVADVAVRWGDQTAGGEGDVLWFQGTD